MNICYENRPPIDITLSREQLIDSLDAVALPQPRQPSR